MRSHHVGHHCFKNAVVRGFNTHLSASRLARVGMALASSMAARQDESAASSRSCHTWYAEPPCSEFRTIGHIVCSAEMNKCLRQSAAEIVCRLHPQLPHLLC